MNEKLHSFSFGAAAAIVSALGMLILGILGNLGLYTGAVNMMIQWHQFFNLTPVGIVTGMLEAAVISFLFLYGFAAFYNKLT
ncbi:MAG: hypothetical protein KJ950_12485 [Proteobacteria bacterium]|nr:hypothetical protein [Pseudomonadota bacterium]MBU1687578.1 hypothetical protein [Pseudomonadota bacterium]